MKTKIAIMIATVGLAGFAAGAVVFEYAHGDVAGALSTAASTPPTPGCGRKRESP